MVTVPPRATVPGVTWAPTPGLAATGLTAPARLTPAVAAMMSMARIRMMTFLDVWRCAPD
jgi:hypothetical protein